MVLPFLTQVIVFILLLAGRDGEAIGDSEALGLAVGVGDSVVTSEFVDVGVGLADASTAAVGNLLMS